MVKHSFVDFMWLYIGINCTFQHFKHGCLSCMFLTYILLNTQSRLIYMFLFFQIIIPC